MSVRVDLKREMPHLFGHQGAQRWLSRVAVNRGAALFPRSLQRNAKGRLEYVRATDPEILAAMEWARIELNKLAPVDTTPEGYAGPTAVPDNWNALLNVAGTRQDPKPIPLMDNDAFTKSLGVESGMRPEHRPFFSEVMRLLFEAARPEDLHIRKEASTSLPYFSNDVAYKQERALAALLNADEFLNLGVGGPKTAPMWLDKYHAIMVYAVHERRQPDSVEEDEYGNLKAKDRTAPTEAEARSGKYDGRTVADKRVFDDDGNVIKDHFAMRCRDVFGMNGPINYFLTAIFSAFRGVYLDRFEATYKTRGDEDKTSKIEKWRFAVGSDVKTMDKSIPRWFFDWFCDELANYLDERVCILIRRALSASYVAPNPWRITPDSYNPMFGPDPFKGIADLCVGLPSGIACNPDLGKLWMTCVYVCMYFDMGAIASPSEVEALLAGRHQRVGLLDSSDDAVFLTNDPVLAKRLRSPSSPYARLGPETPVKYLGSVFARGSNGKLVSVPNIVTYLVNLYCREDSIDRKKPEDWALGMVARKRVYSAAPMFREVNAFNDELLKRFLGFNPLNFAKVMAGWQTMDYTTALVRISPQVIHYKVDPKDVPPEVLAEIVSTIPHGKFFDNIRHLFKVPVAT